MRDRLLLSCACAAVTLLFSGGCSQGTTAPPGNNGNAKREDDPTTSSLFRDVTAGSGLRFGFSNGRDAAEYAILESLGGGVGVFDFDRDGLADLMFGGGGSLAGRQVTASRCGLFRNLGEFRFAEITEIAGVPADAFYNHGVFPADYDNDGFADLAVSGYGGIQLFHNQGDGTFERVADWSSTVDASWSTSIAWGDFNADGALDMYVPHYVTWSWQEHPACYASSAGVREVCAPKDFRGLDDTLYISDGAGHFEDQSRAAMLSKGGKGLGAVAADLDLDGDTDIYVANDTTDNFLYLNDGGAVFEEVAIVNGVSGDEVGVNTGSMGIATGDANNDGLPDLWVTNFERELFALYRNEGAASFTHISRPAGLAVLGGLFVGFGTTMIDMDHDADQDLVVANGHVSYHAAGSPYLQEPLLLQNTGGGKFRRLEQGGYFAEGHSGRGLAHVDLNNDGAWDLVCCHAEEQVSLLAGRAPGHDRWARVQLVGTQSNRDAIGASIQLSAGDYRHVMLQVGGGSYLTQSDSRQLLVAPPGDDIPAVLVTWPSGLRESFPFPTSKSTQLWIEGSGN